MYCLQVVIVYQDYRPCVEVIVKHYNSKENAEKSLLEIKRKYIEENYIDIVEELNYMFEKDYMDTYPFESKIFKVEPED